MSAHLYTDKARTGPKADAAGELAAGAARVGGAEVACPGGMSLDEYSDRVAAELHRRIDLQRALIGRLLAGGAATGGGAACPLVACPRLSKIEVALRETIEVLDETRSAFRSKRLEVLRKKLIGVLSGR
jgi:hypothetical protein